MQATKRKPGAGLSARLQQQPQRFEFVQLINLLLARLRRQGVSYQQAFARNIRFRNSVSLCFPASEVEALAGWLDARAAAQIHITPAFFGLLGAAGTLPLHDSERLAEQQYLERDTSQHALVDVLSNRMTGLFYEACGKYRVEHSINARGEDRLLPMLRALAGRAAAEPPQGRAIVNPPDAAAFYAGILRTRPVAAVNIERVLRDYFRIPIRLEQFIGCWDEIAPQQRSTFGLNAPVLAGGAVLGSRMWRHDLRARLHIGPLNQAQLADFLPGGSARAALAEMMRLFAVPQITFELSLIPQPECIQPLSLTTRSAPRQLGWTTFLVDASGPRHDVQLRSVLPLASHSCRSTIDKPQVSPPQKSIS